jgi:hypothetical protein
LHGSRAPLGRAASRTRYGPREIDPALDGDVTALHRWRNVAIGTSIAASTDAEQPSQGVGSGRLSPAAPDASAVRPAAVTAPRGLHAYGKEPFSPMQCIGSSLYERG